MRIDPLPRLAELPKLTTCPVPGCSVTSTDAKFICSAHLRPVDPAVLRTMERARRAARDVPSLFNYRVYFAAWRKVEEQAVERAQK